MKEEEDKGLQIDAIKEKMSHTLSDEIGEKMRI